MSTFQDPPPGPTTPTLAPTLPHKIREYGGKKSGLHIVVLNDGVDHSTIIRKIAPSDEITQITHKFSIINAIAGVFSKEFLDTLSNAGEVKFIEEDGYVQPASTIQNNAPWGLNRLSAAAENVQSNSGRIEGKAINDLDFPHRYDEPAADAPDVNIYVVDDGVLTTHEQFDNNRAEWIPTEHQPRLENPQVDPDWRRVLGPKGHGTAVAGVAAGVRWGVAKNAHIIAVKLYQPDDLGPRIVDAKAAFEAVLAHAAVSGRPSILNYSYVGAGNNALDLAVGQVTAAGIHFVAGAGNNGQNANGYSPARSNNVICVGASTFENFIWEEYDGETGQFIEGSNYGTSVTVFAPGCNIATAKSTSNTETLGPHGNSGTSLSTAYVSGLIAYLISTRKLQALTPAQMKTRIVEMARKDVLNAYHLRGSHNRLAYNGVVIPQAAAAA